MSKIQTVWVYADAAERYADLIAGARRFGAVVNAVVPCESCAAELRACGPAAVYNLGLAEGEAIENYAETIASLAQGEGNLFLFDATRRSKALAAGVAAKRGAGLVNDALSLEAGDAVKATFRTYGGLAAAAVRIVSADAVVTVGAGVFEPEPADASADIPVIAVEKVAPAAAIVVKERRAKAAASVDLTKAKRVIGIGRGIAKQEDIAMIEAFAKAIGAEIDSDDEQLRNGHGYDHNWVLATAGDLSRPAARLVSPVSGIALEVFTDEPGIQVYVGNFLDGTVRGKHGIPYAHRTAVCLETQHYPDSPNKPQWPSVVLRPGETYHSRCIYRFSVDK